MSNWRNHQRGTTTPGRAGPGRRAGLALLGPVAAGLLLLGIPAGQAAPVPQLDLPWEDAAWISAGVDRLSAGAARAGTEAPATTRQGSRRAASPRAPGSRIVPDFTRSDHCLAAAIYYEAGRESGTGQAAVAQVVLNRLRDPRYPKSVCAVVFQGSKRRTGCQFTFTCDGALARLPARRGWQQALALAGQALAGQADAAVGAATHYHADYVAPWWRRSLIEVARIGAHIFYRGPVGGERPAANAFGSGRGSLVRAPRIAASRAVRAGRTFRPGRFSVWGVGVADVRRSGNTVAVQQRP